MKKVLLLLLSFGLLLVGRADAGLMFAYRPGPPTILAVTPPTAMFTTISGNANSLVVTMHAVMSGLPAFSGTWSIAGTDSNKFNINSSTGDVTICNTKPTCTDLLTTGPFTINVAATQAGAVGSPFTVTVTITGTGSTINDGFMSEAPYGGSVVTTPGTFTWGGLHPYGPPNYYVFLNGTQVDAGDELEIANGGNVYLMFRGAWYGPWMTGTGFGATANPTIHLPTIRYLPQIANSLSDGTASDTLITMIIGKNATGDTYGGGYSMSSADGASLLDNRILVGSGGLTAGTHTYIPNVQMTSPGTASQTSAAPSGSSITNGSGVWTWGGPASGRPGDYDILLNGVATGIGSYIQLIGGTLYANTTSIGWYVFDVTLATFSPSDNPNG